MAAVPDSPAISVRTPSATQVHVEEGGKGTSSPKGEHETSPTNLQKVAAELIGTYILIFIGCGSIFVNQQTSITLVGIALAWGMVVTAVIYTLGHISGAHINPAVTVAFAAAGQFPWKQVPLYVMAQLVGSTLASFSLRELFTDYHADVMLTLPGPATSEFSAVAWELTISFILMLVICGAASDQRAVKELSGVAVGVTIFFNVIVAGKETGASMNPARSIGPAIAAKKFVKVWIYVVAPVFGAAAASTVYNLLLIPKSLEKSMRNDPAYSGSMEFKSIELP